jgi:hypothetical protein
VSEDEETSVVLMIAARILSDNELPDHTRIHKSLQEYLLEVEHGVLLVKPEGELRSTQVIALAIATWKRMNPNEKPYWK